MTPALPARILNGVVNEVTSLLLDVRDLHDGSGVLPIQGEVSIPRIVTENKQVQRIAPIEADLVATSDEGIYRVEGRLKTTLRYQCSRCLDEFESTVKMPFDEQFSERAKHEDVNIVKGSQVELDPLIEETVNLAVEYRPLCRADCRGLCPVCGINLNYEQCSCDRKVADPRWAALKDLLLKDEPE